MRPTALAAILLACATLPASAATVHCMTREQVTDNLVNKYGESPQAWKLDGGMVIEFWAAPEGNWTLFTTSPLGVSCVLKAGDGAVLPMPVVEEAL